MSGARAKLAIIREGGPEVIGIFNNVSYGVTNDVQPIYVLGAYAPVATEYTAQEPVMISASAWRSIGFGPYEHVDFPKLQQLMTQGYMALSIYDRHSAQEIARITHVRPESFGTSLGARQLEEVQFRFVGILHDDESTVGTVDATHETPDTDGERSVASIWRGD
jgi:hypothetical protein